MAKVFFSFLFMIPIFLGCTSISLPSNSSYGVFVGASSNSLDKFFDYDEIIVDASYFNDEQIAKLHKEDVKVYSYLNIGSVEDFRPYYDQLKDMTLGDYENWPEERWLDLSNQQCRDYIVDVLAKDLFDKGIDGFFLDNLDVYYLYNTEEVYKGLLDIITRLHEQYKIPLIANGGYEFFNDSLNHQMDIAKLIYGVNHESVFSKIDFENNRLTENDEEDREFLMNHLKRLKENGIHVYVIEYTKSKKLSRKIAKYYISKGYGYYIADGIELD